MIDLDLKLLKITYAFTEMKQILFILKLTHRKIKNNINTELKLSHVNAIFKNYNNQDQ